ncbi:EamA family transporter RarD [Demequina lutea]|uniref:Chloramphenicol-sensitive protein RarD n=1 Tax=Demequina lutea TaxID=431489 RepID=A0A7Y9ZBK0_9MICO|nr:EamA family transporter RarD [Demequina lutea]NYI42357.1 chloramphenicol-sensitive protein RarD [Demequina lutea]
MTDTLDRNGLGYGVAAYVIWGLFPIIMAALEPAAAFEIVAWRALSSLVVCVLIFTAMRGWPRIAAVLRDRRTTLRLVAAGALIAVNWGVFVYAVVTERVAATSLGYYINPLVTVTLAVVFLGERLRRLQIAAIFVALVAVAVVAWEMGGIPWISLALAGSFGTYSLIKKGVGGKVDALTGLTIETAAIAPVAVVVLFMVHAAGDTTFGTRGAPGLGWWHDTMLAGTGTWTAGALLIFAAGARRLPLNVTGMLQYIAPTMTFVLAVWYFHESMPAVRWIGFGFVWIALVLFSIDAWRIRPGGARAQLAREERARDTAAIAAEAI